MATSAYNYMATPAQIVQSQMPTIALVGRVNVGKSTLFNRLVEKGHALVSPKAGTTRTRNIQEGVWRGKQLRFVDTGGVFADKTVVFQEEIEEQVELALKAADMAVFVVDGEVGILPEDRQIAKWLQTMNIPVRLAVNKIDNVRKEEQADEHAWSLLGFGQPLYVSGVNGRRTDELCDEIYQTTKDIEHTSVPHNAAIQVALIGRPNVGKSSLFNALIGQESVIVSTVPHTTREPFDTEVRVDDTFFVFIDTAGIRKQALIKRGVEYGGVQKSIAALKRADVALLVLETGVPVSSQDKHLAGFIADSAKSVVIVVNKWDSTQDNSQEGMNEAIAAVRDSLPFLSYAPIVFVSAKTKAKVHKLFPFIKQVYNQRKVALGDDVLEQFLKHTVRSHLPSRGKGTRHPHILGMKQLHAGPPVFLLTIKAKTSLHRSYLHFVENRLREHFGFTGTPIVMKLKKSKL